MSAKPPRANPMKEIALDKVTLNMGVGEPGPVLENAKKMMEAIAGRKPVATKAHKRSTFGTAKGRPIGVKVTLRGREAVDFLKNAVRAVDRKLKPAQFDANGNFSFGIAEYINIPGVSYDPDVGIIGLDVAVTLRRPGFRVKSRRIRPGKVGKSHRIKPEEAMEWAKKNLEIEVSEE